MTILEKIEIMFAFHNGKPIEQRPKDVHGADLWCDSIAPVWNWDAFDYRVKRDLYEISIIAYDGEVLYKGCANKLEMRKNQVAGWVRVGKDDYFGDMEKIAAIKVK